MSYIFQTLISSVIPFSYVRNSQDCVCFKHNFTWMRPFNYLASNCVSNYLTEMCLTWILECVWVWFLIWMRKKLCICRRMEIKLDWSQNILIKKRQSTHTHYSFSDSRHDIAQIKILISSGMYEMDGERLGTTKKI